MAHLVKQVKQLTLAGECEDAMQAFNMLQEQPVDLLLLDIEMPGMTGLELVKQLGNNKPIIIFTTSKKEYAVDAFDLNVADYIIKPITPARFLQAITRATEIAESQKEEVKYGDDEFIFIRDSNVVRRLGIGDILYVEAMGDYVKLHTAQKFYAIHTTLRNVEDRLGAAGFVRVHRSFIVAVSKIDTIQDGVLLVAGKSIPVADTYRGALNKRLDIL